MRFFFYGTLVAGSGGRLARSVHAKLRPLGPASAEGRLYGIPDPDGWYPALLPGDGVVWGWLYDAGPSFSEDDLAALDRYEEFDPAAPGASLYLRAPLTVTAGGARIIAEAYAFNQPLPAGARPIPAGDFAAWLAEHGLAGYLPPEG